MARPIFGWLKYLVPLATFVGIAFALYSGLHRNPREVPSPLVGKPAPTFNLARVRTPDKTLSNTDLLGHVSLLNVWASWCVSCRDEHPLLLRIANNAVLPIYGLNYKDAPPDAIQWLDALGDPYTASASDVDGQVGLNFGVYGVPETFLIDQRGDIAYKHIGPLTAQAWEQTILPKVRDLNKASG